MSVYKTNAFQTLKTKRLILRQLKTANNQAVFKIRSK